MNDSFIYWDLERYRFLYCYQNMFDNLEWNLLDLGYMDDPFYRVRNRLLNGNVNLFDDRDDNCFRNWDLNGDRVWHGDDDGLIDFELYVLRQRDDYFFVVFDRLRVFFFYVLVDGVDVGLEVVAAVVTTAEVAAGAAASEVVGATSEVMGTTTTMAAEVK